MTIKTTSSKESSTGSKSPMSTEVAVESLASPIIATAQPKSPVKVTCTKRKESVENSNPQKAAEAITYYAGFHDKVTKIFSPKTINRPGRSQIMMSIGFMVTECNNGAVFSGAPSRVSVYNAKGKKTLLCCRYLWICLHHLSQLTP